MEIERNGTSCDRLLGRIHIGYWGSRKESPEYLNRMRTVVSVIDLQIDLDASGRGVRASRRLLRRAGAEIVALKTARDTALRLAASGLVAV